MIFGTAILALYPQMLSAYSWPGDLRELEQTIERIVILEDGEIILPEHLDLALV